VHDRNVRDLASAVLDGEVIDWAAASARLHDPQEQSVAAQLRTLSRLGTSTHYQSRRLESRRLPWLLELGRGLAIIVAVTGLVGEALALQQVASGRLGVLFALAMMFAIGAAVLDVGGKDRRARALAVCFWTMAAALSTPGNRWLVRQYPTLDVVTLLNALHPDAFMAAGLWQFGRDFPVLARFGALDRLSLAAVRITLLLAVILVTANIAPVLVPAMATALAPFQRGGGYGAWFWNLTFLAAAPAIGVIAWRGRSATGQEAARVRLFLFALAFCVLPIVVEVLAEGLVPSFARLMRTPAGQWWGALVVYTPLFIMPLATAYAVAVDNVLEVRVVIQRALRYLLARWLVVWGAAVPLVVLLIYMVQQSSRPLSEVMADPAARALTWAGGSALILLIFRRHALRALDRWILPGVEDPSVILAQLAERMRQARTPLEVTVVLAEGAERALQTPARPYRAVDGVLMPIESTAAPLPAQSLVRVVLEGSREPCVVAAEQGHSYFRLLSDRDRAWIADEKVVVLLPVISGRAGGGLIGMVTLSERRNALAFSFDDMRFLRAATAAANLACDLVHANPQLTATSEVEEFALECTRCGRVEPRTATPSACACGLMEWATAALPRQLLGRFEITRRLGAGGMGIVYGATDLRLGRELAVKTLTSLSDEAAQRLMVEARAMSDLAHPNIAVLYGAEIWRETPLLIMEFMGGGTLASALRRERLSPAEALRHMKKLAAALVHVHRLNKYHGDIKPSNVGFTRDGVIKFLDFGLSSTIVAAPDGEHDRAAPAASPGAVAGTWAYMSPEVREGAPPGPALDVWAMTVVLFECVVGRHPFAGSSRWQVACDVPAAIRLLTPELSQVFSNFFRHAFAEAPSRYPSSAATLLEALERLDAPALPSPES
jgi:hypothetical protein